MEENMSVYLNEEEGLKRVMNNKKLYIRLLSKFRNDTNIDELLQCVAAKDYAKAETAAHSIKGVSGNLAMTNLFELTTKLDEQLKKNTLEDGLIDQVIASFKATQQAVDEVLTANG
jgi:HPt (histidine-containing phosphotransfer) domain-containing protein